MNQSSWLSGSTWLTESSWLKVKRKRQNTFHEPVNHNKSDSEPQTITLQTRRLADHKEDANPGTISGRHHQNHQTTGKPDVLKAMSLTAREKSSRVIVLPIIYASDFTKTSQIKSLHPNQKIAKTPGAHKSNPNKPIADPIRLPNVPFFFKRKPKKQKARENSP